MHYSMFKPVLTVSFFLNSWIISAGPSKKGRNKTKIQKHIPNRNQHHQVFFTQENNSTFHSSQSNCSPSKSRSECCQSDDNNRPSSRSHSPVHSFLRQRSKSGSTHNFRVSQSRSRSRSHSATGQRLHLKGHQHLLLQGLLTDQGQQALLLDNTKLSQVALAGLLCRIIEILTNIGQDQGHQVTQGQHWIHQDLKNTKLKDARVFWPDPGQGHL